MIRSLFSRKLAKWLAWRVAIVLVLFGLFHLIENYRGATALKSAIEAVQAAGETLEFDELIPEAVPDEDNFGAIPSLKNIALVTDGEGAEARERITTMTQRIWRHRGKKPPRPPSPRKERGAPRESLDEWAAFIREETDLRVPEDPGAGSAEVVMHALQEFEPLFAELESAIDRPHSRFSPGIEQYRGQWNRYGIKLPHLQVMQQLSRLLRLRSHALAELGDSDALAASLLASLRLAELSGDDGVLIGLLVNIAHLRIFEGALWAALDSRTLTAEGLENIQDRLGRQDVLERYLLATRMELASVSELFDGLRERKAAERVDFLQMGVSMPTLPRGMFSFLVPGGWFDQNQARAVDFYLRMYVQPAKGKSLSDLRDQAALIHQELEPMMESNSRFTLVLRIVAPAFATTIQRVAQASVRTDLMRLACALERYFIDQGEYPVALAELAPKYIEAVPLDELNGVAFNYSRTDDERYRIYSNGWDGDDDAGEIGRERDGKEDFLKGDWVWQFDPGE